eukprot:362247-Chlamydomonas_euryale.AAC.2
MSMKDFCKDWWVGGMDGWMVGWMEPCWCARHACKAHPALSPSQFACTRTHGTPPLPMRAQQLGRGCRMGWVEGGVEGTAWPHNYGWATEDHTEDHTRSVEHPF